MNDYNQRTPAEIALINSYIDKWDKILYSTQPIDRVKAEQAVFNAYQYLGLPAPKIYFLTSPSPAEGERLRSILPDEVGSFIRLKGDLRNKLLEYLHNQNKGYLEHHNSLKSFAHYFYQLCDNNRGELFENLCDLLYEASIYGVNERYNMNFHKMLASEAINTNCWDFDFYLNHKQNKPKLKQWIILRSLSEECLYLITWEKICIIIEKPCELHLNRLMRPHADGKAAIKYADGFEVYYYHGMKIPAKYEKINSDNWQAQWILDEQSTPSSRYWHHHEEWGTALRFNIGMKRFSEQLPDSIDIYWKTNLDGHWKINGHPNWSHIMWYAYEKVIFEWILLCYHEYYNGNLDFEWGHSESKLVSDIIAQSLCPSEELKVFDDLIFEGKHPFAPGVYIDRLILSQEKISGLSHYPAIQLFKGDRDEIYYVIATNSPETFSTLYCKLPDREPFIYAECLTSWIVSIAHCYQEGAYYLSIDPTTGEKKIDRDLDKVEQIFEKFNPQQIDRWREVWRS